MPQNQNKKLADLILFSLVIKEQQKQPLIAKLSELSAGQLADLTRVLEAEAIERDSLLTQRLRSDQSAANRYTDTLTHLRRQAFESAEALDANTTLTALDQP